MNTHTSSSRPLPLVEDKRWLLAVLALALVTIEFPFGEHPMGGAMIPAVMQGWPIAAFSAVAAVALLGLWPQPGWRGWLLLLAAGVGVGLVVAQVTSPFPVIVLAGAAAWMLASVSERWWWSLALVLLPWALVMGLYWWSAVQGTGPGESPAPQMLLVLATVGAIGGYAARLRRNREQGADRAARVLSEEQLAVARDLHDGVGHGLAVIAMQAGAALHVIDDEPAQARQALEAIRETSKESLDQLRTSLAGIRGDEVRRKPERTLADVVAVVERVRSAGLQVDLSPADPATLTASAGAAAVIHAVVQEGLTNVLRHAGATRASVELRGTPDRLYVEVNDDGTPGEIGEGTGLAGLRARVAELGGALIAGPSAAGFSLRAEVPAR